MFCSVGDIFCRVINKLKILFAKALICASEPFDIKSAQVQFINGKRGEACNFRLFLFGEFVLHMGDKIIACGFKTGNTKVFADKVYPAVGIKSSFNKSFSADFSALKGFCKSFC